MSKFEPWSGVCNKTNVTCGKGEIHLQLQKRLFSPVENNQDEWPIKKNNFSPLFLFFCLF